MEYKNIATFCLLLFLQFVYALGQNQTSCAASTCGECLTRVSCGWCTDDVYSGFQRCDLESTLVESGCTNITNPHGSQSIIKDDPLGDADDPPLNKTIQVKPQMIELTLRPGETQKITVYVRPAEDYPLDLYYLMDLSKSMSDDLVNLRDLGGRLIRELQLLSSDVQMGFGSFLDKVTLPFVFKDEQLLDAYCKFDPNNPEIELPFECADGFGVRNNLNLTKELTKFTDELDNAEYSTSVTKPEGGMDGLMQMVVCKDVIGWRDTARHILVYTSDAKVHVAGEGRLAAIYTPNDGLCHIDPTSNEYTQTASQDFPSIGQLNTKVIENDIYPLFAVTTNDEPSENVLPFYQEFSNFIQGSTVGVLSANSENIITIIKQQYAAITSKIEMMDTAPEDISVYYTAHCKDGQSLPGSSTCTDLSLGEVVSFDLDITAVGCQDTRGFTVKPFGLKDTLFVNVNVLCSCDCEKNEIPNSDLCSGGNGTLACGACVCNPGRYGKECECDQSGAGEGIENCRGSDSDSDVLCSGRGECVCGQCQCYSRQDPEEVVSGPLCQCDNFSCDRFEGELCGGPKRGKCVCDEATWSSKCLCHKGYTGPACQCPDSTDVCKATTGLVCNGFGECICGKCQCDETSSFRGPTCEDCGICVGDCGVYRECVMCTVFNEGRLTPEECALCNMLIIKEDKLTLPNGTLKCETKNAENCTVIYYYETIQNGTVAVHVQIHPVCPQRQVSKAEPWIIAVAIIVAILLIGLLLILLLRLYIWWLDKKEFAEFEKERQKANWETSTNPIYKPSTTRHQNPMYAGKAVQMSLSGDIAGQSATDI